MPLTAHAHWVLHSLVWIVQELLSFHTVEVLSLKFKCMMEGFVIQPFQKLVVPWWQHISLRCTELSCNSSAFTFLFSIYIWEISVWKNKNTMTSRSRQSSSAGIWSTASCTSRENKVQTQPFCFTTVLRKTNIFRNISAATVMASQLQAAGVQRSAARWDGGREKVHFPSGFLLIWKTNLQAQSHHTFMWWSSKIMRSGGCGHFPSDGFSKAAVIQHTHVGMN